MKLQPPFRSSRYGVHLAYHPFVFVECVGDAIADGDEVPDMLLPVMEVAYGFTHADDYEPDAKIVFYLKSSIQTTDSDLTWSTLIPGISKGKRFFITPIEGEYRVIGPYETDV